MSVRVLTDALIFWKVVKKTLDIFINIGYNDHVRLKDLNEKEEESNDVGRV